MRSNRPVCATGAVFVVLCVLATGGCATKIKRGHFRCDPAGGDNVCPPGWVCVETIPDAGHYCYDPDKPYCGNGVIDADEECDGQQFSDPDCPDGLPICVGCMKDCTICGDGDLQTDPQGRGEECDDGNRLAGDGCSPMCTLEICGNGYVDAPAGEHCDDGNLRSGDGCSSVCTMEFPIWEKWYNVFEEGRVYPAAAYDSTRQVVVLYGGRGAAGFLNDTWEYRRGRWVRVDTQHLPSLRYRPAAACNPQEGKLVLFGGETTAGLPLDDTWTYDGMDWAKTTSSATPSARFNAAMAYDASRNVIVLFGGEDEFEVCKDDTWEYDGEWHQVVPAASAPAKKGHKMVFHAGRGTVVLFSGENSARERHGDTWEYDGTTWTEIVTANHPTGRTNHGLAYDSHRNRIVMYGGYEDQHVRNADTWEFDGADWTEIFSFSEPGIRDAHAMVYHEAEQRVLMVGGWSVGPPFSDTWTYDGTSWQERSSTISPPPRGAQASAYDSSRNRIVLFGGQMENEVHIGDTWEFDGTQWVDLTPVNPVDSPSPRVGAGMTYDASRQRVVLFGGYFRDPQGATYFNDTWEWDGTTWTQIPIADPPAQRAGHMIAFHPGIGKVVMFGGIFDFFMFRDTWVYDGQDWMEIQTSSAPQGRAAGGMVYFPPLNGVVMYGGTNALQYFFRTWVFDGDDWSLVETYRGPPPRLGPGMAYDPVRYRIVLYGGTGTLEIELFDDTWEFDGHAWYPMSPVNTPPVALTPSLEFDPVRRKMVLLGGFYTDETWEYSYYSFARPERCNNSTDDDGDGLVDCDDPDCTGSPDNPNCAAVEICNNELDDDGDQLTDCDDPNCAGHLCETAEGERDGRVCIASECRCPGGSVEDVCDNFLDDDCDGQVDCEDPDCDSVFPCEPGTEITCTDGYDNDGQDGADCADTDDCAAEPDCEFPETTCEDLFDNDGDGLTDCADSDCRLDPACPLPNV